MMDIEYCLNEITEEILGDRRKFDLSPEFKSVAAIIKNMFLPELDYLDEELGEDFYEKVIAYMFGTVNSRTLAVSVDNIVINNLNADLVVRKFNNRIGFLKRFTENNTNKWSINCSGCNNCTMCFDCNNCSNCNNTFTCDNCVNIKNCSDCNNCSNCLNLEACTECDYCFYCTDINKCSYICYCSGCNNYDASKAYYKDLVLIDLNNDGMRMEVKDITDKMFYGKIFDENNNMIFNGTFVFNDNTVIYCYGKKYERGHLRADGFIADRWDNDSSVIIGKMYDYEGNVIKEIKVN